MTWTPYAPDAQGLGWMATREPGVQLEGFTAGANVLRDGAQATEDIDAAWVFVDRTGVTQEDGYELAVYDYDDLDEGDLATAVYRPTGDHRVVNAGVWRESDGTQYVDLFEGVDSPVLTPGVYSSRTIPGNEFLFPLFGYGSEYSAVFGTLTNTQLGRSIAAVRLRCIATELVLVDARLPIAGATIIPYLDIDGTQYLGSPQMVPSSGQPAEVTAEWQANPSTGRSWTPSDLDLFADGATNGAGWMIAATGSANHLPIIFQGWLEVDSAPVDKRLAVGVLRPGGSARNSWQRIELLDPGTGAPASWAKAAGDRPLIVYRRRWGTGWSLWRRVLGDGTYPNGWSHGIPTILPSGRLAASPNGNAATLGDLDQPGAFGLLLERDDGALSIDSQPYVSINDDVSGRSGFFDFWTNVDTAQTLLQEFTPAAGVDVGYLRVLACLTNPDVDDDLTVELVDAGTLTVLATVTFEPEDLGVAATRFAVLEDYLPAEVPLTGGTQYGLRFTCPAPTTEGWRVQVLSATRIGGPTGVPVDVGDVTFAEGVDALRVNATSYLELTAAAQVHSLPDTPTGFTATATGLVDGIDTIDLAWAPTAITGGGGFEAYELQRSDDRTDWQTIALITDEDAPTFEDLEARRDIVSTYRVRVRRVDGAASAWSTEATATCAGPACGYVLATNTAPDQQLWYDTIGERTEFEFPEQVVTYQPIGANGSVVLRELEDRLDLFALTAFIAGHGSIGGTPDEPAEPGQRAFDPLRILIGNRRDPTTGRKFLAPYIAVLAPGGDRWFASVTIAGGMRSQPDGSYEAAITITETTDVAWAVGSEEGTPIS